MSRPESSANSGSRRRERQRLTPGTLVDDRYLVEAHLGDGGFATVYRARDQATGRLVALKVLIASELAIGDFDKEAFEGRFVREARATATLDHPNLATIYGSGLTGEKLYIAMELFEGWPLTEELESTGAIDPQRALDLMRPALDALGHAHEHGIVHRDIKPSNLFLSSPGTPRERMVILDFGVARLEDSDALGKLTNPGEVLGTPSYTAPEALKADITVPACDVYSMGLILLEMLTGRRPVDADSIYATMALHVSSGFPVPPSLFEGSLGPILNRALAPDPEDRFRDGIAFFTALASVDPRHIRLDLGQPFVALSTLRDSGRIPPMPAQVVAALTAAGSNPRVRQAPPPHRSGSSPAIPMPSHSGSNPAVRAPSGSNPGLNAAGSDPQVAAYPEHGQGSMAMPYPHHYAGGQASGHINLAAMSSAMSMDALRAAQQQQDADSGVSLATILVVAIAVIAALGILGAVVWFGILAR